IPETLAESELFGHEKGSFTGADQRKIGKFQYADGGTLFLDEIGDISPALQVKLLRVLQEKRFTPVGSNQEIEANARIIAATNRNLEDLIQKGTFRDDLYYRLSVLPIFLPPLRDRLEDLEPLVLHFIGKFNRLHNKAIGGIEERALERFKNHSWPGNIRELENVIEHAFVLETGPRITETSLPRSVRPLEAGGAEAAERTTAPPARPEGAVPGTAAGEADLDFQRYKEQYERDFIIRALRKYNGRINQTSAGTNMPKKTLLRKIEKYGIKPEDFKK
ncbi:MAG: sigma-54 dependent transcriptional regulator, partial [Pseudomonadota bacterium]